MNNHRLADQTGTGIIGGGLSGLALADILATAGEDFVVLEARDRFGGRILTQQFGAGGFDMGPAWFWDGQPRIARMIERFGLSVFEQFYDGTLTFEDQARQVHRERGFASIRGSYRLDNGLAALIHALVAALPPERLHLQSQVTAVSRENEGCRVTLASGDSIVADHVVFALPPRLAATLTFTPPLPIAATNAMSNIATWMAGQAKALAVYDTPFWREAGFSGDAHSRVGPMVEVHDASPADHGPYALFGFIGVPPQGRKDEALLREHLKRQFERLFGPKAADPNELFVKDWAFDPHTSTQADLEPLFAHPTYGLPDAMQNLWAGALHLSGTEVAPQFGGYIEGALEAAENTAATLLSEKVDS